MTKDYTKNLTNEQKADELIKVREMLNELTAIKDLLNDDLKDITKNGPITLTDGRTIETVITYPRRVNTKLLKASGLYDDYSFESIRKEIKIKG
ncbi:hypothetical protein [uncultured Dubosiella sp.]|uniref:hypothetical protein n=1 Tax=uncultured Dubosiella sp. TaxID=1937011 RepID=UPI002601EBFE|nr:hypothetical protein [uncultured Dubosiella sp.]